jgi:NAD(P)-dependent dehydrogenase (short-subunit alcohol dehydrogenase family)
MGRVEGKVCIVTGAGSGIGRASAALFAEHGALVVAADIRSEASGVTHRVDVTDEASTTALAQAVVDRYGGVDVLFNNAGIAGVGSLDETSLASDESAFVVGSGLAIDGGLSAGKA